MDLIKNIRAGMFKTSEGDLYFALVGRMIQCVIEEEASIAYAQTCAEFLNTMSADVVHHLCEASIRYCNDFLDSVGEPGRIFNEPKDVLSLISRGLLIVPAPKNGDEPIIHLEFNCDWEPEHGLEWIVRGNKVLYVGGFNGQNPWGEFRIKKTWNYA